ncbi:YccF domain-containing protein [Kitasatospora sp. NPDC094015]|uniref:YccF domain-containing protein n=1 Tax=Kitasatospora sp. NPDC094015 TaxID=3155205 RepID=UPI0033347479
MTVIQGILNVLWLIFCGIWMAIAYAIAGIICFILIITIPFGIASFRIAGYVLWPFGRSTVVRADAGAASCVGNVIWLVFAGWWLALAHIATSIPLFVSIIGIPFGWANLKMIPISLMPLGREVVPSDQRFAGW